MLSKSEEVAPKFWIEFVNDQLNQTQQTVFGVIQSPQVDCSRSLIVGMIGFKSPPDSNGSVEIGYGIVPSRQGQGFATQAVDLLVKEGSPISKAEIQMIVAYTVPMNAQHLGESWRRINL